MPKFNNKSLLALMSAGLLVIAFAGCQPKEEAVTEDETFPAAEDVVEESGEVVEADPEGYIELSEEKEISTEDETEVTPPSDIDDIDVSLSD